MVVTKMAPNTTQKQAYKIVPMLELGESTLIEFAKWRVCIKNPNKNRIMCVGLSASERMAIMVYWLETVISEREEEMNFLHKELKEWYEAQDKIIAKACEPVVYDYADMADRDMKWFIKEIEEINRKIDGVINRYIKVKDEVYQLKKAKGAILTAMRSRGFDVEQEVYLI